MSNRLASRVIIVIGSSPALGRFIALVFAENGAYPVISSNLRPDPRGTWGVSDAHISPHELICQRYGEGKVTFFKADVTVAVDVEGLVGRPVEVEG